MWQACFVREFFPRVLRIYFQLRKVMWHKVMWNTCMLRIFTIVFRIIFNEKNDVACLHVERIHY
jgi:hypothetical protein